MSPHLATLAVITNHGGAVDSQRVLLRREFSAGTVCDLIKPRMYVAASCQPR